MSEVTVPAVRKAIIDAAAKRRLQLTADDISALVTAAVRAQATAWVSDEEAMALTGRGSLRSWRDFCAKYGVRRQQMCSRAELEDVLRAMPGRGRPRRIPSLRSIGVARS